MLPAELRIASQTSSSAPFGEALPERRTFGDDHRVVVADERGVVDGAGDHRLVPDRVVHGLHADGSSCGDLLDRRGGVAVGQEKLPRGVEDSAARVSRLLVTQLAAVGTSRRCHRGPFLLEPLSSHLNLTLVNQHSGSGRDPAPVNETQPKEMV